MKKENKSFSVYMAAGVAVGVISFLLKSQALALLLMVAVAAVLVKALDRLMGKEKFKWWLSNGLWIYFMTWIITWIVFYNL